MSQKKLTRKHERAIHSLREYLATLLNPGWQIDVHCFRDDDGGIRVAEVSQSRPTPGGGSVGGSWMRSDPECLPVILAAEDFLLTYEVKPYRPEGWDSDIDDHADARWKLKEVLQPEEAPKRKRKKA